MQKLSFCAFHLVTSCKGLSKSAATQQQFILERKNDMKQGQSYLALLICGFLAVLQPTSAHAKWSDVSTATKWVGGGTLTAGALYLGLTLWQKSLERELKSKKGGLSFAVSKLDQFLNANKIFELQEDIQTLRNIRKVLAVGGAGLGVGLVGLMGRDWGRAKGYKEGLDQPRMLGQRRMTRFQSAPGAVEHEFLDRMIRRVQGLTPDKKPSLLRAILEDRKQAVPESMANYEEDLRRQLAYFSQHPAGDAATVYGCRAARLVALLEQIGVLVDPVDRDIAQVLVVNGERGAMAREEAQYIGRQVEVRGAGAGANPTDVGTEEPKVDDGNVQIAQAKVESLLEGLKLASTLQEIGKIQGDVAIVSSEGLNPAEQQALRGILAETVSQALEGARARVGEEQEDEVPAARLRSQSLDLSARRQHLMQLDQAARAVDDIGLGRKRARSVDTNASSTSADTPPRGDGSTPPPEIV